MFLCAFLPNLCLLLTPLPPQDIPTNDLGLAINFDLESDAISQNFTASAQITASRPLGGDASAANRFVALSRFTNNTYPDDSSTLFEAYQSPVRTEFTCRWSDDVLGFGGEETLICDGTQSLYGEVNDVTNCFSLCTVSWQLAGYLRGRESVR